MVNIYHNCASAAEEYGMKDNLVAGANIAGFLKVANAMMAQGIVWYTITLNHAACAPYGSGRKERIQNQYTLGRRGIYLLRRSFFNKFNGF